MSTAVPEVKAPATRRIGRARAQQAQPRYLMWWLCIALFFEYARPANFVPGLGALPLNSLIPLALFMVCLVNKSLRPFDEIFRDRSARWVSFYIGLVLFSVFTSEVNYTSWKVFELALGYFFICIMCARLMRTQGDILMVVGTLVLSHVFLLAMNPNVLLDPSTRQYISGGTFLGDGNDFSLSICLLLPLAIELSRRVKPFIPRLLCWAMVGLMLLAIIASQSRGAVLGIGAVFFYMWLRSPNKMAGVAVAVVLAGGLLAYAPGAFFDRMKTIKSYETEGSAQGRINAWKAGMRMVLDKPLTGVSAGMYAVSYGTKYKPKGEFVKWANAHSIYFQVIGELGIPGIVTLLALILGNIRANARLRTRYLAHFGDQITPEQKATARLLTMGMAAVIGYAVAGAFLSAAYYPHIFVLTGTMIALRSLVSKELPPDPMAANGRRRRVNGRKASAAPPATPA